MGLAELGAAMPGKLERQPAAAAAAAVGSAVELAAVGFVVPE